MHFIGHRLPFPATHKGINAGCSQIGESREKLAKLIATPQAIERVTIMPVDVLNGWKMLGIPLGNLPRRKVERVAIVNRQPFELVREHLLDCYQELGEI